jgi:hypothetical protein
LHIFDVFWSIYCQKVKHAPDLNQYLDYSKVPMKLNQFLYRNFCFHMGGKGSGKGRGCG